MRHCSESARSMERGSTTFELLVTISLLAIVASGIFGFYTVGLSASQASVEMAVATELAQSELEQLKANPFVMAPRGDLTDTGPGDPEYHWTAEVRPVAPGLSQGIVTVLWSQAGHDHQVTLTTLMRMPGTL